MYFFMEMVLGGIIIYMNCLFLLMMWVQALAVLEAFSIRTGQAERWRTGKEQQERNAAPVPDAGSHL